MKFLMSKFVTALQIRNTVYLSIPLTAREMLGLQKGDKFTVEIDGDKIIYTKVKED
ncbi:MAG: AbrB/MazE/SpoVT family DNA-binding domain-containing protein [Sarcina sp.]